MNDTRLKLSRPNVLTIPEQDAQALISAGNGDAALVYLHVLMHGGTLDASEAATELHRSDGDIRSAVERLRQMGLLSAGEETTKTLPSGENRLPEYTAADVVRRSAEDPKFRELVQNVQTVIGRSLTSSDLKKLFGIYSELALPTEVVMMLMTFCKTEHERVYGSEKPLGFAFIEKEAYIWHHAELITLERAEEWVAEHERRRSATEEFFRTVGIRDRAPSATEKKYVDEWLGLGFGVDALALAADRTVTNTGGLKWKYMDSIVRSWHNAGLHTVEEIEKGDRKKTPKGSAGHYDPVTKPSKDDAKTLDQLRRLREKMKNNG